MILGDCPGNRMKKYPLITSRTWSPSSLDTRVDLHAFEQGVLRPAIFKRWI